jgi:hypothetical protein
MKGHIYTDKMTRLTATTFLLPAVLQLGIPGPKPTSTPQPIHQTKPTLLTSTATHIIHIPNNYAHIINSQDTPG